MNSKTAPALSVVLSTHQGARDYQEDAMGHWSDAEHNRLFAVVADGAGGHGGGTEASQAAIQASEKSWRKARGRDLEDPEAFLTQWMEQAHLAVNEAAAKIHRSARSVVVGCLIYENMAFWAHAGDSRLLRFHDGQIVERTRDDSVVQVLFERGEITEEEMGTHPDQSRLLQSLGGEDPPKPRHGRSQLQDGDVLILCSDGFWEHLRREELEELITHPSAKRQRALDRAVQTAVKRAGPKADNTTAIMIHCGEAESAVCSSRWLLWLLLAAALGSIAAWWVTKDNSWPWDTERGINETKTTTAQPIESTKPSPALPEEYDEDEPDADDDSKSAEENDNGPADPPQNQEIEPPNPEAIDSPSPSNPEP